MGYTLGRRSLASDLRMFFVVVGLVTALFSAAADGTHWHNIYSYFRSLCELQTVGFAKTARCLAGAPLLRLEGGVDWNSPAIL